MSDRFELHKKLRDVLGNDNVYFQPPSSILMKYPAIVYTIDEFVNTFADNEVYAQTKVYSVTVIDKDPDSTIVDKISKLPTTSYERHYEKDNLNHDVFTICH